MKPFPDHVSGHRAARAAAAASLLAAVACGIELQTAAGDGSDAGSDPSGSSSGDLPGTSSSSSGAPTSSGGSSGAPASSSSSSGAAVPPDTGVPADPCDSSTQGVHYDTGNIATTLCDQGAPDTRCLGSAEIFESKVRLTRNTSQNVYSTGVFWRRVDLGRNAPFSLTLHLSTRQPPDAGGIPGYGFGFAFVQRTNQGVDFPPALDQTKTATFGINQLDGFRGAGAYLKTYSGTNGVFALRATAIPSASADEVDDVNGSLSNADTFGPTDSTALTVVFTNRPGLPLHVKLTRDDPPPHAFTTEIDVALPNDLTHFDMIGVSGARGDDGYATSGHRLDSLDLTCTP